MCTSKNVYYGLQAYIEDNEIADLLAKTTDRFLLKQMSNKIPFSDFIAYIYK